MVVEMPQKPSPIDWQHIKELLAEALPLNAVKRRELLDAAGFDPETRAEIESLLDIEPRLNGFMSLPAAEISHDFLHEFESSIVGQSIGKYKIISELGIGGMGAVYMARREAGDFDQVVAIKMLRRELNTATVRRNFEREKAILARLTHPNIARLLNAGTTDDKVPYLVMEYVDGVPIDVYCRERDLGLVARLKLFNKVAAAVAYAHRNLIVHRDLKPSNILITSDGEPKLLDFGISKILDEDGSLTVDLTAAGLTPAYASPEQLTGAPLTTATDVYSLGVVLFKLLTGSHPFRADERSNGQLLKAITEGEPRAPSLACGSASGISSSVLKGDIDNILLKALSSDPERRYASPEEFAADVWRFIDGQPVFARKATLAYQLSRLYKRKKIAVVAAVVVTVSVLAGAGAAIWQARSARAQAAIAVIESDNAKAEQDKAEKISRFMMKIISYANPNWHAEGYRFGGEARVIDALNDMASKIDAEFADQPAVLAELHHQFSDAYNYRKEPDSREKARSHAKRALELRRAYYGDWHELVAKDMVFVYWTSGAPKSEENVRMLSDAIVMMRATNPKNLNLPFMLEDYIAHMTDEKDAPRADMYLRLAPQPAPNDRYLAADQFFDEMLSLLRQHFSEDSAQMIAQKCSGSLVKLRVNKAHEANDFYQTCMRDTEYQLSMGKRVNPRRLQVLADYRRIAGTE